MSNRLLKLIQQGRLQSIKTEYLRLFGKKQPEVLDKIFPNLTANLQKSSELFIQAVFNNDKKFIQSTSTRALRNLLFKEMQGLKKSQIDIKRIPIKPMANPQNEQASQQKSGESLFTISPYVIFGKKIKDRCQQLQESVYICSPSIYIGELQNILNDHIYGFHCYYRNASKEYQIIQKSTMTICPAKQMVVTFETDSEEHEFFVADFNYMMTYEEYEKKKDEKA